jgi:hypothetical protein
MKENGQLHILAALHPEIEPPVSIEKEAGWAPQPVWTLSREKSLAPAWNRTPAAHPVARCYTDWAIPVPTHNFIYT